MQGTPTTGVKRGHPMWAIVGLFLLTPIAAGMYGTVHLHPRMVLAAAAGGVGAALTLRSRYVRTPGIGWAFSVALLAAGLGLVPVPASLRVTLQGDVGQAVVSMLALTGAGWRPLALDPSGAVLGATEVTALGLLGLGVAGFATRASRARALAWSMVATGLAVAILVVAHTYLEATSIYGSGVGLGAREGFFAPFVNPNHGGLFLAALAPLALSRSFVGSALARMGGIGALVTLSAGTWASGSRAAVLALALGLSVTVAAIGGRRQRIGVLVLGLLSGAVVGLLGPSHALELLTSLVAPEVNQMVAEGYTDLTTGRLQMYGDTWRLATSAPLLGVGTGGFDIAYPVVRSGPGFYAATHAHNDFLQGLAEHGFIAVGAGLLGLVLILRRAWSALDVWAERPDRRWLIASFLGLEASLCLGAAFDFPMRLGSHSLLGVVGLGVLLGLARPRRGGRTLNTMARRMVGLGGVAVVVGLLISQFGHRTKWASPSTARASAEAWLESDDAGAKPAAEQHLKRAVTQGLQRSDIQRLAAVQSSQGRTDAATATLEAGTLLYPAMPWLWRDKARLAALLGDDATSRNAWKRLLELDLPGSVDPVDVLHEAFFGGPFETPLERASAVLPERPDRYRQGARVMDQLGLVEESETLFRRALAMDPAGIHHYADALLRWGRPADAALLLDGGRSGCKGETMFAHALLQLDRVDDAVVAFSDAIRLCGARGWNLRVGLAKARLLAGDSRGDQVAKELLDERPDAHGLRRVWVWVLSRRGRTVEGAAHLQALKDAGVLNAQEQVALDRASRGLPFEVKRPVEATGQSW